MIASGLRAARLRWTLLLVAAGLALWAFVIEPRRLVLHTETLELPAWPAALAGLRVAVLSDLHVGGRHVSMERLGELVAVTNARHPDLIVLLGDYVNTSRRNSYDRQETLAARLGELRAPLGVWAVLGNHDWWTDGPRMGRALTAAGIHVLNDAAAPIDVRGVRLWLAGIPDYATQPSSPARAARAVPPGATLIYLTHNPDIFPAVGRRAALTLAGHTHGGQLRLPLFGAPVVPSRFGQRYAAGHVVEGGRHLFVTTGIGTSILPMRFGVPPEIVLLTLR